MYVNPQPDSEELKSYYPEDYEAYVGIEKGKFSWLHRIDYRYGIEKRYRAIMRYTNLGRMLDVGCGCGAFLAGMRNRGWETLGIEPNSQAATYAREELSLEIKNATLENVNLESESFDLVTMWNVLEHLSGPQDALYRISETLKPGGILVFAVPSTKSYDLKIFGKYWAGYDIPRHLYVFPTETLKDMVKKAKLEILERRCIYGTYHALAYSAQFAINDNIASDNIRSMLKRVMLSLPVRAIMIPLTRVIDFLNRGTIMTWFCRKGKG
jgi:2-polyprenyl-3-methyl-5-hydroxy-6-metoxy-1,4-benzoquinol methylase